MKTQSAVRLTKVEVKRLLDHFDDSSDTPLHEGLDFISYSEKLSKMHILFSSWKTIR